MSMLHFIIGKKALKYSYLMIMLECSYMRYLTQALYFTSVTLFAPNMRLLL